MTTRTKIACLGEGMIVFIPEQHGALHEVSNFHTGVAGAELNVATALSELGVSAAWLSRVGDDGFGRRLMGHALDRGIDVRGIEIDPARSTGIYVKEMTRREEGPVRSRMHYYRAGSAASALAPHYLARAETQEVLSQCAILHTTGITASLSASARDLAFGIRGRFSGLVSVDANWRPALWRGSEDEGILTVRALMADADIVFVGADEADVLLGTSDPLKIRDRLQKPRYVIVKNDAEAATAFDGTTRVVVPTTRIHAVEPIGAGDAFAAGVLAALSQHEPLDAALRAGHATARRALLSAGDHL